MVKVKKALIAAAGLGTRMFPFTKVESKLMVPVINKPVIQLLLEELTESGIEEVIIVTSHMKKVKDLFKEDEHLNKLLKILKKENFLKKIHHLEGSAKLDFIAQDDPYGWMHEVLHAKTLLKDGPFVVCFSDVLYSSDIPATKQAVDAFDKTKKNIKCNGRFVLKPTIFDLLKDSKFVLGQDLVDLDIFEKLQEKNDFYYLNIDGEFHNIGEPLSYLKTVSYFGLKKFGPEYKKYLKELIK